MNYLDKKIENIIYLAYKKYPKCGDIYELLIYLKDRLDFMKKTGEIFEYDIPYRNGELYMDGSLYIRFHNFTSSRFIIKDTVDKVRREKKIDIILG